MVATGTVNVGKVQEALYKTGLASLRELSVEESEEMVVIRGSVPSYYCKQVAQETALATAAGRQVVIHISVNPSLTALTTSNEA